MSESKTQFEAFLEEELEKYRGVAYPVHTNWLLRTLITQVSPKKLHPNPEDEFCIPKIGPNSEIISNYEKQISLSQHIGGKYCFDQPLTVERMKPEGYLLLNGHHRWAAALRRNVKRVPIQIVNATHTIDIQRMLHNAKSDKRVTLDLDEVVLAGEGLPAEKALSFPLNLVYRQRLRRGALALFSFFQGRGYDVWVYSSQYHSPILIKKLFLHHRAHIDGLVTGLSQGKQRCREHEKMRELLANQYPNTVNIDAGSVVFIDSRAKTFEEFELSGSPETWSREVMDAFEKHKTKMAGADPV